MPLSEIMGVGPERRPEELKVELSITDLIAVSYETQTHNVPGRLRFYPEGHEYHVGDHPNIDSSHVLITQYDEETGVEWSFNLEDIGLGVDAGSVQSDVRRSSMKHKYKIRHEFVAEALGRGSTDRRLREFFRDEDDGEDNSTPDFMWEDAGGNVHVLEVTTTRNNTHEGLKRAYEAKAFKYQLALELRAMQGKVVTFTVIVVSLNLILSSIALPRWLVSELILRMRIGVALENLAKSKGYSFESDRDDHLREHLMDSILNNVKSIQFLSTGKSPLTMDYNFVRSCLDPPDEKEVVKIFTKNYISALKDVKRGKFMVDTDSMVEDFIQALSYDSTRTNKWKPIVNLPLFAPYVTKSNVEIPFKIIPEIPGIVETKLWSIAFDTYRTERVLNITEDPRTLLREALETDPGEIKFYQESRKSNRSKYHRVRINRGLTSQDREALHLQGLWAKSKRDDPVIKMRRKESQKPFHWDVPLDDIDEFLNCEDIFKGSGESPESDQLIASLLDRANNLVENSPRGLETIKLWMTTGLYQAMNLISDIGLELAISNKQNCQTGEAILKKLRYYDAYILIFPTKSTEHAFFTLYFPSGEPLSGLPFRNLIRTEAGWISSLVSVKQGKLENWCSAASTLICLISFWSWFYDMSSETPTDFLHNPEARRMLLFSLLVRLEDKAQTEEAITLSRYMYMESLKGLVTPVVSNPFKMLEKFSTKPRSRLCLWVMKRLISAFKAMDRNPPRRFDQDCNNLPEGEDALPKDTWVGLLNFVTGSEVTSISKVVNLMYIGYLKNKNESPEGNTDFQLIEKTVEEELKLDLEALDKSFGVCSAGDPPTGGKQFSLDCIKYGCTMMEKRLQQVKGDNWKDVLKDEILANLSRSTTEFIASLKASSSLNHQQMPGTASFNDRKSAFRVKVIQAISEKLDKFSLNPFTKIAEFLQYIESTSGGVVADLFKKQQHGGLREIYVLTIESRVVQLFIEVISRTLCSYFDEETLTHPKNKLRKINDHRKLSARLAQKRNCLSVDLCSSNDKTRWNQNFVMPAMAVPLIRLTHPDFHPAIMRILNLWSNKLIKIPTSVTLNFLSGCTIESKTYKELYKRFWSPGSDSLLFERAHQDSVRLSSGMMQGILHYTSSLLHLTFLSASSRMAKQILSSQYPDYSYSISQICSSDDSATMMTIFSPPDCTRISLKFIEVCSMASIFLESQAENCKYFCMSESVKSTVSLIDYVEFNSEFLFQNTVAIPVIKFLSATLVMSESESFLTRFHTQYNLIADLFSSGLTSDHCHLAQLSQAILHYKTMGASTNSLFGEWCKLILKLPDPKYGFFILDTDMAPGVLGFSYGYWMVASQTRVLMKTLKEFNTESWVTTPEGGVVQTLVVKHGEVRRWKSLVKVVLGDRDLERDIEKDPSILFRHAENKEEVEIKLAIKATSPGVGKSMNKGNPFMQAMAMSVYSINTHCFSKCSIVQDVQSRSKVFEKVCILGELKRRLESSGDEEEEEVYRSRLQIAFPNSKRYSEMRELLSRLHQFTLISCPRLRNRKNELIVQPRSASLPVPLLDVLKSYWFGMPVKASQKIVSRCLKVYREAIPWIQETIKESLGTSPFTSYQELYNFVSSEICKVRVFRRTGPAIHSRRLVGQMYNLVRKSKRPCGVLREPSGSRQRTSSQGVIDLVSKVNLALNIPIPPIRSRQVKRLLEDHEPVYDDLASVSTMTRRESTLAYIQGILRRDFSLEDVASHMKDNGQGTHISYIKEQRKVVDAEGRAHWVGEGSALLFLEGSQVMIHMRDHYAERIYVNDLRRFRSNLYTFNQTISELGLAPMRESGQVTTQNSVCLARYNGSHLTHPSEVGTPVYQMREDMVTQFDPAKLSLRFEMSEMRLVQTVSQGRRLQDPRFEVSMLKYKTRHSDIILSQRGDKKRDPWQAWIEQSPCDDIALFNLCKDAMSMNDKALRAWLRDTLNARLSFKNFGTTKLAEYDVVVEAKAEEEPMSDEEMIKMRSEINLIFMRGNVSGLSRWAETSDPKEASGWADENGKENIEEDDIALERLATLGLENPIPNWVNAIKNWAEHYSEEATSIIQPTVTSFYALHPFWDIVIEDLMREKNTFWYEVLEGSAVRNLEEISRFMMKVLEIREVQMDRRPGMAERFAMAMEMRESLSFDLEQPVEDPCGLTGTGGRVKTLRRRTEEFVDGADIENLMGDLL